MKDKKTEILVLLASYNGSQWIEEQIDSILLQETVNVTLLISDDRSRDDTFLILNSLAKKDNRIIILSQPDFSSGSAGSNFRRLIKHAQIEKFDFIAFADQDDIWLPKKLFEAIACMREFDCKGYSSAVESFWPNHKIRINKQNPKTTGIDFLFEGAGQGCTFVMTKELFSAVQHFSSAENNDHNLHYHDWFVYLIAKTSGYLWFFDSRAFIKYRQHSNNEIGARGTFPAVFRRLSLIRSGWYQNEIQVAVSTAVRLGFSSIKFDYFRSIFHIENSLSERLKLAVFLFRFGRRRLSDRVVLALSAVFGWV